MRRLWYFYLYLLLLWGSFRYFIQLPEVIEELWFKPMIWLIPLFWWQLSMKGSRVVLFGKEWLRSLCLGTLMAMVYFVLVRKFELSGLRWDAGLVGIILATAVTEELTFSGFVAGYLEKMQKDRLINLLLVGLMVAVVRIPILVFIYKLGWTDLLGVVLFAGASGTINAWIRVRTGNVAGSILARMGMNLAMLG